MGIINRAGVVLPRCHISLTIHILLLETSPWKSKAVIAEYSSCGSGTFSTELIDEMEAVNLVPFTDSTNPAQSTFSLLRDDRTYQLYGEYVDTDGISFETYVNIAVIISLLRAQMKFNDKH